MKKVLTLIVALSVVATMFTACGDGFKTTDNGLKYKFIEVNKGAQQLQMGDVLVCTLVVRLDTTELRSFKSPDRYLQVVPPVFKGDLSEGLLMMHVGDKAIFGVNADSISALGAQMPDFYKKGAGMTLYYEVNLIDIVSENELQEEMENYNESLRQLYEQEKETLAQYAKDHNIKASPDEEGLYVVVNKKGNGPKVEIGREVEINYTGRLLDGKVFDTSVESVAAENNILTPGATYKPLSYQVGSMNLIPGWEKGVINQPAGSKLTLLIPSALGYGPRGAGDAIPPNSPLVFDIEIVSVK